VDDSGECPFKDEFLIRGRGIYRPPRDSSYVASDFVFTKDPQNYRPSQPNTKAAVFALHKFKKDFVQVEDSKLNYMNKCLQTLFAPMLLKTTLTPLVKIFDRLQFNKAAGLPWNLPGAGAHLSLGTKGQVIAFLLELYYPGEEIFIDLTKTPNFKKEVVIRHLLSVAMREDCVCVGQEKDEIRDKRKYKQTRLFMPTPIQYVVLGALLFQEQNDALINQCSQRPGLTPFTPGIEMPGPGLHTLYMHLYVLQQLSSIYAMMEADGGQWDAKTQPSMVQLIRDFRKLFLPSFAWDLVDYYYDQVYYGDVLLGGWVISLFGQRSGHFNTTTDNTLINIATMVSVGFEMKWTPSQFLEKITFFCNGDDLLFHTKDMSCTPRMVREAALKLGVYYEMPGDQYLSLFDCHFLGTQPVIREIRGAKCFLYKFRSDKLLSSGRYKHKKNTVNDEMQKLVSLLVELYGDAEQFEQARLDVIEWLKRHFDVSGFSKKLYGSLISYVIDESVLYRTYTGQSF
jgi:hypothetical protein